MKDAWKKDPKILYILPNGKMVIYPDEKSITTTHRSKYPEISGTGSKGLRTIYGSSFDLVPTIIRRGKYFTYMYD